MVLHLCITYVFFQGCLTFPSGDKIDGTFSGTWNQGLKISGTFHKTPLTASMTMKHSWHRVTLESVSRWVCCFKKFSNFCPSAF